MRHEALSQIAAAIAVNLARVEELLDEISSEVRAVEHSWKNYAEMAPLGLRRRDIGGGNVLRFDGLLEAIVVERLRFLVHDAERPFNTPVPSSQSLADVGTQVQRAIDDAIAAHERQQRVRCATSPTKG